MLNKFVPASVVVHFSELTAKQLLNDNIKLFLCDIDNTLVGPDDPHISEDALAYLRSIKNLGIEVALISNNTNKRVATFNEGLYFKTYAMALKPCQRVYKQIKKDYPHINTREILSLGDQIMTDVLGSNLAGIKVVLTKKLVDNDLIFTKINRLFENFIIKILKKRKKWPNEEM